MSSDAEVPSDSQAFRLAKLLAGKRARTRLTQSFTGLGEKTIRRVYGEANEGERPTRGKLPSGDATFLHPTRHLQASYAASMLHCCGFASDGGPSLQTTAGGYRMLNAFKQYEDAFPDDALFDINVFYQLAARFLREGAFVFKNCDDCTTPYLVDPSTPNRFDCPFCAEFASLYCTDCSTLRASPGAQCANTSCASNRRKPRNRDRTQLHITSLSLPGI